jgi:tripartite-type tricarboxylate transporter receptor subunit TctC
MRLNSLLVCGALLALAYGEFWSAASAGAEDSWPRRQVRLIVPFPGGSANDAAARFLAEGLETRWRQVVVVENKPGGDTVLGAAAFVNAKDDHTLLYTVFGTLTVAPLTVPSLSFDPGKDLVPIAPVAAVPVAISVNADLPVHTLADLEATIRSSPGTLSWASGPTLPRYVFAAFLKNRGLEMTHVTYRDASLPQIDLGEGRIQVLITAVQASRSPVMSGKARFVAVTDPQRLASLPEVPTASEAGYSELTFVGGAGVFGWRGMDDVLRARIAADVNAVVSDAALRHRFEAAGHRVIGGTPQTLSDLITKQRERVIDLSRIVDLAIR